MNINQDITQRAVLHTPQMDWVGSPASGVQRKMLERVGDEVARASICRFPKQALFELSPTPRAIH